MQKSNKNSKILTFFKDNLYYFIVVLILLTVALVIAFVGKGTNATIIDDGEVEKVNAPTITYSVPLANFNVIKDYSDSELLYNATLKRWEAHKAMDLSASDGADVMAVADGKVISVYSNYLEGTVVVIQHENNMRSLYGSLGSDVSVKVGDEIKRGDVIGVASNTANSEHTDGAHLHFEFFRDGVKVNPNDYISFSAK